MLTFLKNPRLPLMGNLAEFSVMGSPKLVMIFCSAGKARAAKNHYINTPK